jgi:hypothetical protein
MTDQTKIPAPEPCAHAHRYSARGLLHTLRDNRQDAEDDAAIVGGSAHAVALYDELALETYAAAREAAARMEERAKLQALAEQMLCKAKDANWFEANALFERIRAG